MPEVKNVVGAASVSPKGAVALSDSCEIARIKRGTYEVRLASGLENAMVDVTLLGHQRRNFHVERLEPCKYELRTFSHSDTPTMLEDTGFEIVVSIEHVL